MALLVCPKIQMSIERKAPTIPTAANASVALVSKLPTTAASVEESSGSAMLARRAGTAILFMFLKVISGRTIVQRK